VGASNERGDFLHEMNRKAKNGTGMVDVRKTSSSCFLIGLIPFHGFGQLLRYVLPLP
jgi:hypothetical protein